MYHHRFRKQIYYISLLVLGVVFTFCNNFQNVNAATLYITPASTKVSVGNIVSAKIMVSTDGRVINNSDAVVKYPNDLLEVISVSKNSSIFSLWVEEPKFSNFTGEITLNGGLPNPGYIGSNGEIITIVFKAKKQGTATVLFADSAVRQNDGLGTDILTTKSFSTIQIEPESPLVKPPSDALPPKPIILSSSHPQQNQWYSKNSASFSWIVPNSIVSIQTELDKSAYTTPTITYDSSVSQRTVTNISDGISYFHVRYMNNIGWGPVAHYKVQIDTVAPEKFIPTILTEGNRSILLLNARDLLSGVDSYSLRIDNNPAIQIKKDLIKDDKYLLPVSAEGDRDLSITVYDKAGNTTEAIATYYSSEIIAPIIKLSSDEIITAENVVVSGTTEYPDSNVNVVVQFDNGKQKIYSTKTLKDGSFSLTTDDFKSSGSATIWSQLVFSVGVMSPTSDKIQLRIQDTEFTKTAKTVLYSLLIIIPTLALIIILLLLVYVGWHRYFGLKRRIKDELEIVAKDIHKSLMNYKEELSRQLQVLEKIKEDRELNEKEENIFKELQKNIDSIDEIIENKLRNIK